MPENALHSHCKKEAVLAAAVEVIWMSPTIEAGPHMHRDATRHGKQHIYPRKCHKNGGIRIASRRDPGSATLRSANVKDRVAPANRAPAPLFSCKPDTSVNA